MWYLFQCLVNNRKIDKAFEISLVIISWYRRWDNHCSPYISNIFFTSYLNFITSCLIVWIIMALSHFTLMASCLDPYIHYFRRESISSLFFILGECPDTGHHYSGWAWSHSRQSRPHPVHLDGDNKGTSFHDDCPLRYTSVLISSLPLNSCLNSALNSNQVLKTWN